jgi:hypothetical protein
MSFNFNCPYTACKAFQERDLPVNHSGRVVYGCTVCKYRFELDLNTDRDGLHQGDMAFYLRTDLPTINPIKLYALSYSVDDTMDINAFKKQRQEEFEITLASRMVGDSLHEVVSDNNLLNADVKGILINKSADHEAVSLNRAKAILTANKLELRAVDKNGNII